MSPKIYIGFAVTFLFYLVSLFNWLGFATLETHFAFSLLSTYIFVMFICKCWRDIISFRFEWSILDDITWQWLKDYLLDQLPEAPESFDGWHQLDGLYLLIPMATLLYWGNYFIFHFALWILVLIYLGFTFLVAYPLFTYGYHHFFMKPEFKGKTDKELLKLSE